MLELTALFLAAAVVAVPIFKRLGLGSVLGYLAAGAAIGPSGFGFFAEVEETLHFAELGVVLLLFLIGLELQPSRLWRLRTTVFGLGGAQVAATTVALLGIGLLLGASWRASLVGALALAMSSTAFATQILGEKNEMATPHGRSAFGILLFQDLAAIPILAIIPMLAVETAATTATSGESGWLAFAKAAGVIAGLVVAGRLLLRPLFHFIAKARSQELSVASALLVVIGTALLMYAVGLSMALGAFIAGVLLADSEYRHELEANIEPFKGLLLGLFFMAVGMSANLGLLLEEPLELVALALLLVAVKLGVLVAIGRFAKLSKEDSASLGIAISQGGEFAFVIFGVGTSSGVMGAEDVDRLVVVVTLSMVVTPLLFLARDRVLASISAKREKKAYDAIDDEQSQVLIAGFGRVGQIVGRILRLKRIKFTALDASPEHVDLVRRFGNKIYYGDASRIDLLRSAGAERAKVFVLAVDDFEASMRILAVVKHSFPHLEIVARARNRQHAYALLGAGVTTVIRETFAASLDTAQATLEQIGVPSSEARDAVRRFGDYDEEMVRQTFALRDDQKALIDSAKKFTTELERIFDEDVKSAD